jgi:hypothetical protein
MTPADFKNKWLSQEDEGWSIFPADQVEKSNLSQQTKDFLKVGLPNSAAPFLSFQPISGGTFETIHGLVTILHPSNGDSNKNNRLTKQVEQAQKAGSQEDCIWK